MVYNIAGMMTFFVMNEYFGGGAMDIATKFLIHADGYLDYLYLNRRMDTPPIRSFFKVTTGKIKRRNRDTDPITLCPDDHDISLDGSLNESMKSNIVETQSNASNDTPGQGSLDLSMQSNTDDDTLPYDDGAQGMLPEENELMLPDNEDEATVSTDNLPIVYRRG